MVKFLQSDWSPSCDVDVTRGGWDSIGCDLPDDEKSGVCEQRFTPARDSDLLLFPEGCSGFGCHSLRCIRLLVELEIQPLEDGQRAADNHNRMGRCVFRILCILESK